VAKWLEDGAREMARRLVGGRRRRPIWRGAGEILLYVTAGLAMLAYMGLGDKVVEKMATPAVTAEAR